MMRAIDKTTKIKNYYPVFHEWIQLKNIYQIDTSLCGNFTDNVQRQNTIILENKIYIRFIVLVTIFRVLI